MSFKQRSPLPIIEGGTNTQSFVHAFGVAYYDGGSLNNIDPEVERTVPSPDIVTAPPVARFFRPPPLDLSKLSELGVL